VDCIGTCWEQFQVQTKQMWKESFALKSRDEDKQAYSNNNPGAKWCALSSQVYCEDTDTKEK